MYQVTYSFSSESEMKSFVDRVSGGGGAGATAEKRGPGRPPGSANKASTAKHSRAEVNAALQEVKDRKGTETAKQLIASLGFAKMNDITEDKFDTAFDAAKAKLAEPEPGNDSDSDI